VAGNREFGNLVRALREAKKKTDPAFSLRQFAVAVGISATYLSKVETGEFDPPAPAKVKKMAELLGYDADELLALAGRVDPELNDIIRERPKEMAEFLRSARGMTAEQMKKLLDRTKREAEG
jgi:HTH-type transcriptional regulator, competence development regulator